MQGKEKIGAMNKGEEKFYEFIEGAAHDLQAPLRKISTLVDRAFKKDGNKFDEATMEYVRRIESCVDEMKLLLNGLLELVREDGTADFDEMCDLNEIARQLLEYMDEEVKDKRVTVQMEALPVVRGNMTLYKQMFKNLLENAFKFSKRNNDSFVNIRAAPVNDEERNKYLLDNKKYYRIEISDNGIGFDPSNDEKVFEPFVRLHPRSEYVGNGLGLFICKKIVARHKGIIYAEGNETSGARFILILPETPWP